MMSIVDMFCVEMSCLLLRQRRDLHSTDQRDSPKLNREVIVMLDDTKAHLLFSGGAGIMTNETVAPFSFSVERSNGLSSRR